MAFMAQSRKRNPSSYLIHRLLFIQTIRLFNDLHSFSMAFARIARCRQRLFEAKPNNAIRKTAAGRYGATAARRSPLQHVDDELADDGGAVFCIHGELDAGAFPGRSIELEILIFRDRRHGAIAHRSDIAGSP